MTKGDQRIMVTLVGECFATRFQGEFYDPHRSGGTYVFGFLVDDMVSNRGTFRLLVLIPEVRLYAVQGFRERQDAICLNAVRSAFDQGSAGFDVTGPSEGKKEFEPSLSSIQKPTGKDQTPDPEVRAYLIHKSYWLGYKYSQDPARYWVDFADPLDVDYLSVSISSIKRNLWLLGEKGLLNMRGGFSTVGKPTHRLIELYESRSLQEIGAEKIFPKGTQWESYKEIAKIFGSARSSLQLVDNYMAVAVLDMLAVVPTSVRIAILTQNTPVDFRVALARFNAQYPHQIEVRKHSGQIHDRFVVIDDRDVYSLGASVKDAGDKLWTLKKLDEGTVESEARKQIESVWQSAALVK